MKNILIVANQPQRFLDQLRFADILSAQYKNCTISFYINKEVNKLHSIKIKDIKFKIINNLNIDIDNNKIFNINELKNCIKSKLPILCLDYTKQIMIIIRSSILYTKQLKKQEKIIYNNFKIQHNNIIKLVEKYNINIIFLNGDRHIGCEPIFLKISNELNIPTIIPYLADFADKERLLRSNIMVNKIKTKLFTSKYILNSQNNLNYRVENNKYYYSHPMANALQIFEVLTSNPYVMGSGKSDILCLNNKYYKNLYIKNGVSKDKISLTGDFAYDNLYYLNKNKNKKILKEELLKKYNLNSGKRNIIIALPQLAEHGFLEWDEHWKEIEFLITTLSSLQQNLLVSLHPKTDIKQYEFLELKYNCKILDERLSDVLPVADVFIATFSSTVVWAVLCGIKTIVVDFYNFNYRMYDFLTSIKIVRDKTKFNDVLIDALNKEMDFRLDWELLSRDDVFDGKTIQRYIDLIDKVSNE